MNTDQQTLSAFIVAQTARLAGKFSSGEAQALMREVLLRIKGWTPVDIAIKGADPVSGYLAGAAEKAVDRLLDGEPVQYIFGVARFCGLDFTVTPDVLIPRPETAELVDLITDRYRDTSDLRILDICTGSGCIACALARALPFAVADATDISQAALEVARKNARDLKVNVNFTQADALAMPDAPAPVYDLIVSNPPYVLDSERKDMESNVLDHEPHIALFVPDSDPLRFYRPVSRYARTALKPGGTIWFEINPLEKDSLTEMLRNDGWDDVTPLRDTASRYRFITATQPE